MAKPATIKIRLNSTADTGHFYVTKKNPRNTTEKMTFRKYDPVARKHVEYKEGKIDRLFIVNNVFLNTMSQKPTVRQLLPVVTEDSDKLQKLWDYIYEPSAAELLDGVLMRYIESQVYQGAVENVACEMAARMVAMKSATDNAGKLIDELQLIYNKARQAAITKEISEIVGGAAAV